MASHIPEKDLNKSLTVNKLARFLHFNNIVQFDKLICKVIY